MLVVIVIGNQEDATLRLGEMVDEVAPLLINIKAVGVQYFLELVDCHWGDAVIFIRLLMFSISVVAVGMGLDVWDWDVAITVK